MSLTDHPYFGVLRTLNLLPPRDEKPPPPPPELPSAPPGDPGGRAYAEAALRDETRQLAEAPEGIRNDTLNRAAFNLGSLVAAGYLAGERVVQELAAAARKAGLPQGEIDRTMYRAARDGSANPRQVRLTDYQAAAAYTVNGTCPAASPVGASLQVNGSGTGAGQVGTGPGSGAGHMPAGAGEEPADPSLTEVLAARYPLLDWAVEWDRRPDDVDWLAYPVLERGGMYALYSPAKAGKSLLALDICAGLATGRSVLGRPARPPVTVLYVDMENGTFDIVGRLKEFGYTPSELAGLRYLSFPAFPALDSVAGGAHLTAVALSHTADVVVIDTVSRFLNGGENDSDTFHALYRHTLAPLKRHGITVVRLDHSGKDEVRGMRGSSAKISDVDVAWRLSRVGEGRLRLDRIAARNAHHPEYVWLSQHDTPLRHEVTPSAADDTVTRLVRLLDQLGIPPGWGRDRVRQLLVENGVPARNEELAAAIRARRGTWGGDP